jgi:hypothetical protein
MCVSATESSEIGPTTTPMIPAYDYRSNDCTLIDFGWQSTNTYMLYLGFFKFSQQQPTFKSIII